MRDSFLHTSRKCVLLARFDIYISPFFAHFFHFFVEADVYQTVAKEKRKIRRGEISFCGDSHVGSVRFLTSSGLTTSRFFPSSSRQSREVRFLQTARRSTRRFFTWPQKTPRFGRLCRLRLFVIDIERMAGVRKIQRYFW